VVVEARQERGARRGAAGRDVEVAEAHPLPRQAVEVRRRDL
jgi:hypothetical protein